MFDIKLKLQEESWKNLFYVINNNSTEILAKGNFWEAISYLEEQFKQCIEQKQEDIDEVVSENQLNLELK
jgi:N-acetylglucosamine kinase-like BadF-type ATPase